MTRREKIFDVVVLGAGSSGAAAAWMLAKAGATVALVDGKPLTDAGAHWIDDIPPWMFDRAGVDRPQPPEKTCDHLPMQLIGHRDQARIQLRSRPMWGVDMRHFVARLQGKALAAGVQPFPQSTLLAVHRAGPRPTAVILEHAEGELALAARLFVDATGHQAALLRQVPDLSRDCPAPRDDEVIRAVQYVFDIVDSESAHQFLDDHRLAPEQVVSWVGLRGGFSSRMLTINDDLDRVELLAGVTATQPPGSEAELIDELRATCPWIGELRFGGGGAIPLRRPYDRLAGPGIALIGDAGCQVFPAHGSGVGAGLIAARCLADALRGVHDPGSFSTTWAYQAAFLRERGGIHGAYDLFRRTIQELDGDELEALMSAGLITEASSTASLDQRLPPLEPRILRSALKTPMLATRLGTRLSKMFALARAYQLYPKRPDRRKLRRWSHLVAQLAGWPPDIQ